MQPDMIQQALFHRQFRNGNNVYSRVYKQENRRFRRDTVRVVNTPFADEMRADATHFNNDNPRILVPGNSKRMSLTIACQVRFNSPLVNASEGILYYSYGPPQKKFLGVVGGENIFSYGLPVPGIYENINNFLVNDRTQFGNGTIDTSDIWITLGLTGLNPVAGGGTVRALVSAFEGTLAETNYNYVP